MLQIIKNIYLHDQYVNMLEYAKIQEKKTSNASGNVVHLLLYNQTVYQALHKRLLPVILKL